MPASLQPWPKNLFSKCLQLMSREQSNYSYLIFGENNFLCIDFWISLCVGGET